VSPVLGIVGSGQLALYLSEAAQGLGFEVAVLADAADAPAVQRADRAWIAGVDEISRIAPFLASCDAITFDKEAISSDILTVLMAEGERLNIRPGVAILQLLQDKALQKAWLRDHGLPTLPFAVIEGRPDALTALTQELGHALVQKRRTGGYDGRGVQILKSVASLGQFWDVPSMLEPYLPGCQEIAVITVRTHAGEVQTYPPVSMEFDAQLNAVRTVTMPAAIGKALCQLAKELAERTVTLLQGVGVFAIEMFVTPAGDLLINEISPRVHNSGHLTQDACNVSQFEQHVRAVMGLPLVAIVQRSPAAMCNILYTAEMEERCPASPVTRRLPESGAAVYWYGKAPGTAGRKMGHINAVAGNAADAVIVAQRVLAQITDSHQECIV
jgi:5-(carboxyamino)imidazole ribonucleotide synthase